MAKATTKKAPKTTRKRARNTDGTLKADDPNTPDVNEAWEQHKEEAPAPAPKPTGIVWFESREQEPSMFPVADISPIRNFSSGRLEYEVEADDVARFSQHHFVQNGRVRRKAE